MEKNIQFQFSEKQLHFCNYMMVFCEWRLPVLISTHEPLVIFSLPCPVTEDSDRETFLGAWNPDSINPSYNPKQM